MIILGIDPGTATTGFGVVRLGKKQSLTFLDCGVVETPKTKSAGQRLLMLELALSKILLKFRPSIAVIERVFFFKNAKTALPVSEARGVLLVGLAKRNIKVFEISPPQLKMAITGYGRADKKQIQHMVKEILCLKEIPRPDDAADALALAIAGSVLSDRLVR